MPLPITVGPPAAGYDQNAPGVLHSELNPSSVPERGCLTMGPLQRTRAISV
ncbi:MAG: hypothetical protein R3C05_00685 [Pirellulaceae bacterium]